MPNSARRRAEAIPLRGSKRRRSPTGYRVPTPREACRSRATCRNPSAPPRDHASHRPKADASRYISHETLCNLRPPCPARWPAAHPPLCSRPVDRTPLASQQPKQAALLEPARDGTAILPRCPQPRRRRRQRRLDHSDGPADGVVMGEGDRAESLGPEVGDPAPLVAGDWCRGSRGRGAGPVAGCKLPAEVRTGAPRPGSGSGTAGGSRSRFFSHLPTGQNIRLEWARGAGAPSEQAPTEYG